VGDSEFLELEPTSSTIRSFAPEPCEGAVATSHEFSTNSTAQKSKAFAPSWIVIVCAATALALALLLASETPTFARIDDPWIVQGP
jgi:hypothetical protein